MSEKIEKSIILKTIDGKTSTGKAFVTHWSHKERMRRMMKFWGGSWGLAILSVFLPLAHFLLVPLFLLIGPIGAYFVFKQESAVSGGEALCPGCGKTFRIESAANKWPLDDVCSECQTHVTVNLSPT